MRFQYYQASASMLPPGSPSVKELMDLTAEEYEEVSAALQPWLYDDEEAGKADLGDLWKSEWGETSEEETQEAIRQTLDWLNETADQGPVNNEGVF